MKISMLALGSTGDVLPYIALGKELQKRGHSVRIASFSTFRDMIEKENFDFFPIGGDSRDFISVLFNGSNGIAYLWRAKKMLKQMIVPLLEDIEKAVLGSDIMLSCYLGDIYQMVAEKIHIPYIQTQYFPMEETGDVPIAAIFPQNLGKMINRLTYRMGYFLINAVEAYYLNGWRKQNGLSPHKISTKRNYSLDGNIIPVIYAVPEEVLSRPKEWSSSVSMTGFWRTESTYTPDEALVRFLKAGTPPVYIGFGSMNGEQRESIMRIVALALEKTGLRAVIATGWGQTILPDSPDVFQLEYVSHDWLFPWVCATVHHGGAGTTAASLYAGKPMLIIPFGGDQGFWGGRAYTLKIGPKPIPVRKLTASRLAETMTDLVSNNEYRKNAELLSKKLKRCHPVEDAADMVEKAVASWQH